MVSGQRRKLNSESTGRVVDGKKAGFNEGHATSFLDSSATVHIVTGRSGPSCSSADEIFTIKLCKTMDCSCGWNGDFNFVVN